MTIWICLLGDIKGKQTKGANHGQMEDLSDFVMYCGLAFTDTDIAFTVISRSKEPLSVGITIRGIIDSNG